MTIHTLESIYTLLRDGKTKVMGILNVTPDSFSGDGLLSSEEICDAAVQQAERFISQGSGIIDIGGESTRPGAAAVSLDEELGRIIPVIEAVRAHFPEVLISVDTMKPAVAQQALAARANILNDVSGIADSGMIELAVEFNVPLILMHSQHSRREREGVLSTAEAIAADMTQLVEDASRRGLNHRQIILDPGIGFGKTVSENLALIHGVNKLAALGYPVLLGVSRKTFIGHTTGAPVDNRLPGSLSAATIGVMQGATIVRVHDVAETVQAVRLVDAVREALA